MTSIKDLFNFFVSKFNVQLVEKYDKVTLQTSIKFKCLSCDKTVLKSYKKLLNDFDVKSENDFKYKINLICHHCFVNIMH